MGLTNWPNANIRKGGVTISKTYPADRELKDLNRLTPILLDILKGCIPYETFKMHRKLSQHKEADAEISERAKQAKGLPKRR